MRGAARTIRSLLLVVAACLCAASVASAREGATDDGQGPDSTVRYEVSLGGAADHVVHVEMYLAAGASERELRIPVWNALYQVRDFSRNILKISATAPDGTALVLRQTATSSWALSGALKGAVIRYDVYADEAGPYGAQLNDHHAFLNLAQVLLYDTSVARKTRMTVEVRGRRGWHFSTAERIGASGDVVGVVEGSYDEIVDVPVEGGLAGKISFKDGLTLYNVLVDADPRDYDSAEIESSVKRIVHEEIEWMKDQPCPVYTFIYHFPHGKGGGGMEHACATAIDVQAERMSSGDMSAFDSVTAHEFFHLWNVKRIRPQSLEPIDYSREQDTRALWFSEGVTSTVEDVILLRSGLITKEEYLRRLSYDIDTLQQRPARKTQSAEESSLQAWLEKYPFYRRPERSISYYNKGDILGVMLDLSVREASGGSKSLRNVFLWMNENFAKQGRFFPDSEGVRAAVEAVTGRDFGWFFEQYVAGTTEIPYDRFLKVVGYRIEEQRAFVADTGFSASRNFDGPPTVFSVQPGGEAEKAGLKVGDAVLTVNKRDDVTDALFNLQPGETVQMRVRTGEREREIKFRVGSKEVTHFAVVEVERPTSEQLRQRAGWLAAGLTVAGEAERGVPER